MSFPGYRPRRPRARRPVRSQPRSRRAAAWLVRPARFRTLTTVLAMEANSRGASPARSREASSAYVAGYCGSNGVAARCYHKRDLVPADACSFDWFAAKSMEGSLPLGPGITPAFCVPDPQDLRLRLWVNGELQQDESTGDMVCSVAELIAAASEVVTLEPGDVIATGTPSGVGAGRGLYLRGGCVVGASTAGRGPRENTVIDSGEKTS